MPIYILEAEIVLGVLYRKGVIPKKGGTLGSRDLLRIFRPQPGLEWEFETKEKLVGAKTAPTAISRTFTTLLRRIRPPE